MGICSYLLKVEDTRCILIVVQVDIFTSIFTVIKKSDVVFKIVNQFARVIYLRMHLFYLIKIVIIGLLSDIYQWIISFTTEHCSAENFSMLMRNQLVDQLFCKTTNVYTSKNALHINRKL